MAVAIAQQDPLQDIGLALRKPEQLTVQWRDATRRPLTFAVLAVSTIACLAIYGLTTGMPHGLPAMGRDALFVPLSALLAWSISFPALYIVNTSRGSTLDRSTTALAVLVAAHFGALARLASSPLNWFFGLTVQTGWVLAGLHALLFGATALCMADVFMRVMKTIDPKAGRAFPFIWLCLVALIDVELKLIFFPV